MEYLLYGGSGHAKVIIDILNLQGHSVVGIFDDNSELKGLGAIPVAGIYRSSLYSNCELIISIGDNYIRRKIAKKIIHKFGIAIARSSIISPSASIGLGCALMQGTIIQADSKIGEHCIINTGASVDHDCTLYNFVHISPNATLCGNVTVGENTHIGAGATIIQDITIGKNVIIGAGALIIKDVPDNAIVVGNPGRIIKYNE